jgi:membrane protein
VNSQAGCVRAIASTTHIEGNPAVPPPGEPTDLPKQSLRTAVKRARKEFRKKNLTMLAAALTYYGVLAAVPGLIVLFTLLGFLGRKISNGVAAQVNSVAPGSSGHFVQTLLSQAQSQRAGTGIIAIVSVAIALWSASSYVSSFRQAANVIYEIGEGRPVWKTTSMRLIVSAVAVVLLVICCLIVVVSGSIANAVGNVIGAGHTAVVAWSIAKWPVLLLILAGLIAFVYWTSPNVKQQGLRWVTPGGVAALVVWMLVSALFAVYVSKFSSYSKDYGPLAGMVAFLVWLWLSNVALLLGLAVNSELQRAKAQHEGLPDGTAPFVEPRDTRKLSAEDKQAVADAQAMRRS